MSQSKPKGKQRDPPPSLFLHPSPAASHVSLPGILAPGGGSQASTPGAGTMLATQAAAAQHRPSLPGGPIASPLRPSRNLRTADSSRSVDRTDALWAEMQATLEEVELSASGGTHVFGPDHDQKLAELRAAQIALAQAWARSEADDAIETKGGASTADDVRNLKGDSKGDASEAANTTAGTSGAQRPGSSGVDTDGLGAKLEEETEVDIRLARKRREANDRYFQRVNLGVLDVVAKLGEVAVAMKDVEQDVKDIWGENESPPGSAKT